MLRLDTQLNPEQLRAVETIEGPLLILAGAGSGKTRVITYRIAHLIENRKVRADQILAVTFTNKAAEQMRVRVQGLLRRGRAANPHISTFHSFCVRVLRPNIGPLGYGSDFSIYDQADQLTLIRDCLKELQLSDQALSLDGSFPGSRRPRTAAGIPGTSTPRPTTPRASGCRWSSISTRRS